MLSPSYFGRPAKAFALRTTASMLTADFERYGGDYFVPHDRQLAAGVAHVGKHPRELLGRERQRAERHRRADDVFVRRVAERAENLRSVLGIEAGLRLPVRDDQRPVVRLQ